MGRERSVGVALPGPGIGAEGSEVASGTSETTVAAPRGGHQVFGSDVSGQERADRPSVKRPAWLFSARASVSSHSATSVKPSSRAVLAKPGYISVYS